MRELIPDSICISQLSIIVAKHKSKGSKKKGLTGPMVPEVSVHGQLHDCLVTGLSYCEASQLSTQPTGSKERIKKDGLRTRYDSHGHVPKDPPFFEYTFFSKCL